MSITNPTQLVEECARVPRRSQCEATDLILTNPRFKKSGEFDRLRRELLKEFRQSVGSARLLPTVRG